MSVTHTQIDEYDSVALIEAFDGWQTGTPGVVQGVRGSSGIVEITDYDESRDFLDHILVVEVDRLRLVHKHHHGAPSRAAKSLSISFRSLRRLGRNAAGDRSQSALLQEEASWGRSSQPSSSRWTE